MPNRHAHLEMKNITHHQPSPDAKTCTKIYPTANQDLWWHRGSWWWPWAQWSIDVKLERLTNNPDSSMSQAEGSSDRVSSLQITRLTPFIVLRLWH
jgi:hypothetical protein